MQAIAQQSGNIASVGSFDAVAGRFRTDPVRRVHPQEGNRLRAWVGVGGSPESVVRAARYGLPLMIAIIGGESVRFAPFIDLYHRVLDQFGFAQLPVGVHSPGHVAETDRQALDELWPHWQVMRNRIGAERGWGATSRAEFEHAAGPDGALYAGHPRPSPARSPQRSVRSASVAST